MDKASETWDAWGRGRALRGSLFLRKEEYYANDNWNISNIWTIVGKLVNDKDLIINDLVFAEEKLKECGYFNIIGGYKVPFIDPSTRKSCP